MDRDVFLVSGSDLAVEFDTLPLHVLGNAPIDKERAVGQLVVQDQSLFEKYGLSFGRFHPEVLKEFFVMARAAHKELDLKPLIEIVGLKKVIDQIGWDRVIDELRKKKAIPQFLERLSPRKKAELRRYLENESHG